MAITAKNLLDFSGLVSVADIASNEKYQIQFSQRLLDMGLPDDAPPMKKGLPFLETDIILYSFKKLMPKLSVYSNFWHSLSQKDPTQWRLPVSLPAAIPIAREGLSN